jgi:hypothetical protein
MNKKSIELTADQLFFLYEHIIKAQLRNPSIVEAYCLSICESKAETVEQVEWHTNMLKELASLKPIASLNEGIQKIIKDYV